MRGSNVLQQVIQRFYQKKEIDDEMIFGILNYISERVVEGYDDAEEQGYEQCLRKMNKMWQYQMYEQMTSEQSWLYGEIWGSLRMLSFIKEKRIKSQKKHALATKYQEGTKYVFLSSVCGTPGLKNRELAKLCDVSTARISQIANEALSDGLISVQEFGKEKCYFIRILGKCVYNIVYENNQKILNINKASCFSYNEEGLWEKDMRMNFDIEGVFPTNNIRVAVFSNQKQDNIESKNIIRLKDERRMNLCVQNLKSLPENCANFYKLSKEIDMINQL